MIDNKYEMFMARLRALSAGISGFRLQMFNDGLNVYHDDGEGDFMWMSVQSWAERDALMEDYMLDLDPNEVQSALRGVESYLRNKLHDHLMTQIDRVRYAPKIRYRGA